MASGAFDWIHELNVSNLVRDGTGDSPSFINFLENQKFDRDVMADSRTLLLTRDLEDEGEKLRYRGFDLDEIKKSFLTAALKKFPNLNNQDPTLKNAARKSMLSDVKTMLCFLATRTNNISKIADLGDQKGRVQEIFRSWNIRSSLDPTDRAGSLTLVRVSFIFPSVYFRALFTSGQLYRYGKHDNLEPLYHSSNAPALIPRNEWGKNQLRAWESWAQAFNDQINSERNAVVRAQTLRRSGQIAQNQFTSGYSHAKRLLILLECYANISDSRSYTDIFMASKIKDESFLNEAKADIVRSGLADDSVVRNFVDNILAGFRRAAATAPTTPPQANVPAAAVTIAKAPPQVPPSPKPGPTGGAAAHRSP